MAVATPRTAAVGTPSTPGVDEVMEPETKSSGGSPARSPLVWVVHLTVFLLVAIWTIPTLGIFISSFRAKDQIATSGWWTSLTGSEQNLLYRAPTAEAQKEVNGKFVITGNVFEDQTGGSVSKFGFSSREPDKFAVGEAAELRGGEKLTVQPDGNFEIVSDTEFGDGRGQRIFVTAETPPSFSFDNYKRVLTANGVGRSFINSLTVAIPATIIPILIAAFAAYALAWMQFPGRALIIAIVVGLLVVPLQMSLIPLLTLYNNIGAFFGVPAKTYLGIWLAHTGFGLPLAIYLLRNYMTGLPREILESARVDGASDFEIFLKIILPLSFPALASFAIFQFLWTWNDLLIAIVFLGAQDSELVLTGRLVALLGSRGGDWEILTASAFVSIIVPLCVFFALQRYLVRGLLAGSVKGG